MMVISDFIAIGAILIFGALGWYWGFGKVLKSIVSGIAGKITAGAVAYFMYGFVLNVSFVKDLMAKLVNALTENGNWLCKALLAIRIDMIILGAVLFLSIYLLLRWVAKVVAGIMESKIPLMPLLNKLSGVVLMLAYAAIWVLIAFQVCAWIWGADAGVYPYLKDSLLRLDDIYLHNPLNAIFETIKHSLAALMK